MATITTWGKMVPVDAGEYGASEYKTEYAISHAELLASCEKLKTSPAFIGGEMRPVTCSPEVARDKALAYVNEARAAVGYSKLALLPKGTMRSSSQCVLQRALPGCVAVGNAAVFLHPATAAKVAAAWRTAAVGDSVLLPGALSDFVSYFDNGRYPELVS